MALEVAGPDTPVSIQVHWFDTDKVENVDWEWNEDQKEVEPVARGVQSSLYAFADGKAEGDGWVGIVKARERAMLIQRILDKAD
jgi:hypothetical protein